MSASSPATPPAARASSTSSRCPRFALRSSSPGYASSKMGLIALTMNLARRWANDGIRVNAIAPGLIDTRMTHPAMSIPEVMDVEIGFHTPLGRPGTPAGLRRRGAVPVYRCRVLHHRQHHRRRRRIPDGLSHELTRKATEVSEYRQHHHARRRLQAGQPTHRSDRDRVRLLARRAGDHPRRGQHLVGVHPVRPRTYPRRRHQRPGPAHYRCTTTSRPIPKCSTPRSNAH